MTEMLDRITKAMRTYSYMRLESAWGIYQVGEDFVARGLGEKDARDHCDRLNALEVMKVIREPLIERIKSERLPTRKTSEDRAYNASNSHCIDAVEEFLAEAIGAEK